MAKNIVRVCARSEIETDSMKAFEVSDRCLAVFNIGGEFYVTNDECTHASGSLAEGILDGSVVECCLHSAVFDVRTGEVMAPPASLPLRTYKVLLQDDDVYIDLDKNAAGEPA